MRFFGYVLCGYSACPPRPHRTGPRVHPESGERGLFIGGFAQSLIGLDPSESRDLLRIFQAYVIRPENIVRIAWSPGDRGGRRPGRCGR